MNLSRLTFILLLIVLCIARWSAEPDYIINNLGVSDTRISPTVLKVAAGHLPGLVADFQILDVFSLYGMHERTEFESFGALLYHDLQMASLLDPQFKDTYRLASSLLVFDAGMPEEAVMLLQTGTKAIPNSWEPPFFGGFIAAHHLHDYELGYSLMRQASLREGSPPAAVILAARYLKHHSGKDDAMMFLQGMSEVMPKKYTKGIEAEMHKLSIQGE